MHQLRNVSIAMTLVGLALIALGMIFDLPTMWTLVGLLLAWAGIVKVVVVVLWKGIFAGNAVDRSPRDNG